jgi:hypothetical protein
LPVPSILHSGRRPGRRASCGHGGRCLTYTVTEGERILYGQRIDGIVRVTDRPASQGGRAYLVERGLETKGELDALVADYLGQATKLDSPPLAICPLESNLEANA